MPSRRGGRLALALLALPILAPSPGLAAKSLDEARAHHLAGRVDRALAAYRAVAESDGSPPAEVATARNNACVLLLDHGRAEEARRECEEALALRRRLDDPRAVSRTLNNLGLVLQVQGEPAAAEAAFDEALSINRRRGDAEAEAINLANLGVLANSTGEYARALELHRRAGEVAAAHPGEEWSRTQLHLSMLNRGGILETLGAYREALALYRPILDSPALDRGARATLRLNLGVIHRNLGDPVRAVEAYETAAALYRELGDPAGLSKAYLNLGIVHHLDLARPEEAEAALRRALELALESGDRLEEILDRYHLGRLLIDRGRLDEAEEQLRLCLELAHESGSAAGRWSALDGLGGIAEARGDPQTALRHYAGAMGEIERVRATLEDRELRAEHFADKRSVYAAPVRVLMTLERERPGERHAARALEIVERAKARDLTESLGAVGPGVAPLSAADLVRLVPEGLAVDYFATAQRLYAWQVGDGGLRGVDLGPWTPVRERLLAVHASLSAGRPPAPEALEWLSARLLAPLALPAEDAAARLWIAGDRELRYLPFELLPAPGAGGARLLETATVSYLPSLSALDRAAPAAGPSAMGFVGFGSPDLSLGDGDLDAATLLVERFALQPLDAAAEEIDRVRREIGGPAVVRLGGEATETAFKEAVAGGAEVVHLATHTVVDERPGGGASILLAASAADDGLLRPREIAGMGYRGRLTVLAACRTALGEEGNGRALTSLAGAFLAAGSSAVLATLWDVGDEASRTLMEQFYHELGRGRSAAEALRRAKRRMASQPDWAAPSLWAGYVVIGDHAPVSRGRTGWIALAAAVVALLALAGRALLRRRRAP